MSKGYLGFLVVLFFFCQVHASCNLLYSFESSVQGWFGGQPPTYSGSASQATMYNLQMHATDGTYSLKGGYDYADGDQKAVFLVEMSTPLDFSQLQYLNLDVYSSGPPQISVALSTGTNWVWHETPMLATQNGEYSLGIDLSASTWKTEASGWANNVPLANRNQVYRIAVTLFPTQNGYGEIYLDNIRLCSTSTSGATISSSSSSSTSSSSSSTSSTSSSSTSSPTNPPIGSGFVTTVGTQFSLNGCPFYVHGSNNYYMTYVSQTMTNNLLNDAVSMGLNVLRIWAFVDGGGDKSNVDPNSKPYPYQKWSNSQNSVVYDDSAQGMQVLDYAISAAKSRGIRLILVLTNNWVDFGGADQYLVWLNKPQNHYTFFTDSDVKQVYKNWVSHVVNRVNSITGITYKNDPTIFAWELINEPRCWGSSTSPPGSSSCSPSSQINSWISEMSTYVRSLDSNHMIAVGDEGFFKKSGVSNDQVYDGTGGDFDTYLSNSAISYGSYHLYPSSWGKSNDWGLQYIQEHITSGNTLNKPVLLEEFGIQDQGSRKQIYGEWLQLIETSNSAGDTYWMLASKQDDGSKYPDYDGYTVYNDGSDAASVIRNHSTVMKNKAASCAGSSTLGSSTSHHR